MIRFGFEYGLRIIVSVIFFVIIVFSGRLSHAQKNQIWIGKTTDSFILNTYGLNDSEFEALSMFCETEFERITNIINHAPTDRITLYFMSNSSVESELLLSKKEILSMKCHVYISDEEEKILGEISIKIAQFVIGDMLERKGLRKVPAWFYYGGAAYFADDAFIETLSSEELSGILDLDDLEGMEAMIAGKQIFGCMDDKYGVLSVANTFNLIRIFLNAEKAISQSIGMKLPDLLKDCDLDFSN